MNATHWIDSKGREVKMINGRQVTLIGDTSNQNVFKGILEGYKKMPGKNQTRKKESRL